MKAILALAVPATLLLSLQAGCSVDAPVTSDRPAARADALIASVDASPASRQKAGITKWNFYRGPSGEQHAEGVDEAGTMILTITSRTTLEGNERVRTLETSAGGLFRVTQTGKVLESHPDNLGFALFADDMRTIGATGELATYDCGFWYQVGCLGYCAGCAVGGSMNWCIECDACGSICS